MKAFLAVGLFAVLSPAVARADDAVCSIRVLEAPAEVRDALVGWAAGEKICHALEVRITPTGEGYSLWAHSDDGRTFTRWVADPKTAALLVVSWAGDDTLPAGDPPPRTHYTVTTRVRQIVPQEPLAATTSAPKPSSTEPAHEIGVAFVANGGSGEDVYARVGIRATVDLTTHGAWRIGLAGMYSDEKVNVYDYFTGYRVAQAYEPHASFVGYIARSLASDRIRLGLGAGFSYAQLSDVMLEPGSGTTMFERVGVVSPAFELSAIGSFPIVGRWSINGGVVITATGATTGHSLLKDSNHAFAPDHDDGAQVVGAIGVARSM